MKTVVILAVAVALMLIGGSRSSESELMTQIRDSSKVFKDSCPKTGIFLKGGNQKLVEQFVNALTILYYEQTTAGLAQQFGKLRFGEVINCADGQERPMFGNWSTVGPGSKDLTILFARTSKWLNGPGLAYHIELIDGKQALVLVPSIWVSKRLFATVLAHELYHVANLEWNDRVGQELEAHRFELKTLTALTGCNLMMMAPKSQDWLDALSKIRVDDFSKVVDKLGEPISRDEAVYIITAVTMAAGLAANNGDQAKDRELYQFMQELAGDTGNL